ncbi:hypothetical protein ES707_12067 [subsurface metagenome]
MTLLRQLWAMWTIALSSSYVYSGTQAGSIVAPPPPLVQIFMKSTPSLSCSRTALMHSSTPSAILPSIPQPKGLPSFTHSRGMY